MLSVVIPAWSGTPELAAMVYRLCERIRPMCDQLILTEDGECSFVGIKQITDVYLKHGRFGHANNLKLGCDYVTCDFVALIDSDIQIEQGDLRELCIPDTIVYPRWNPTSWKRYVPRQKHRALIAWFLVAPKSFIETFPPYAAPGPEGIDEWGRILLERFPTLWSDKLTYSHEALTSYRPARTRS